jgi:endoglucanase
MRFAALLLSLLIYVTDSVAETRYRGMQIAPNPVASDMDVLGSWKANIVRYQVNWEDLAAADASTHDTYFAWLNSELANLDAALPALRRNNLNVVLALYTPPGGFTRRDAHATHRMFVEPWAADAFIEAWQMIATRYKDESIILGYDLVNEPAQSVKPAAPLRDWYKLAYDAVAAIRAIDSTRTIFVGPRYDGAKFIKEQQKLPFENIEYTIHFYDPFKFLHQGIGKYKFGVKYPTAESNKKYLEKMLKPVITFAKKKKARIFVGEFSAIRWAPQEGGYKYLKDVLSIFEKQGWDWTFHGFREASPWNVEIGSNRDDETRLETTNRKTLLLQYFNKNQ